MYPAVPMIWPATVPTTVGDIEGSRIGCSQLLRQLGEPEVEHLRVPPGQDEDVVRLDVAVDDARGVRGAQRVCDLDRELEHPLGRRPSRGKLRLQRLALQVFLHDESHPRVVLANVVDGGDVRMVETRRGAGLALEPHHAVRIDGELGRQDLDRHLPVEARVMGQPDLAHAALAELFENLVRPQPHSGFHGTQEYCPASTITNHGRHNSRHGRVCAGLTCAGLFRSMPLYDATTPRSHLPWSELQRSV